MTTTTWVVLAPSMVEVPSSWMTYVYLPAAAGVSAKLNDPSAVGVGLARPVEVVPSGVETLRTTVTKARGKVMPSAAKDPVNSSRSPTTPVAGPVTVSTGWYRPTSTVAEAPLPPNQELPGQWTRYSYDPHFGGVSVNW
ncbi:hypothetical protein ACFQ0B_54955 [Nonomuraea thailandensis]